MPLVCCFYTIPISFTLPLEYWFMTFYKPTSYSICIYLFAQVLRLFRSISSFRSTNMQPLAPCWSCITTHGPYMSMTMSPNLRAKEVASFAIQFICNNVKDNLSFSVFLIIFLGHKLILYAQVLVNALFNQDTLNNWSSVYFSLLYGGSNSIKYEHLNALYYIRIPHVVHTLQTDRKTHIGFTHVSFKPFLS